MDVGARYLDMTRLSSGAGVDNGNNILRYGGELGRLNNAADQKKAEEATHRISSFMLAVHSDPNICASGVR